MSKFNARPKILFIMTGSIACFKACQIISLLVKKNFEVKVVMTSSAQQFIGTSTVEGLTGSKPYLGLYDSGSTMEHIHLIRWCDVVLVAPATANYINKISKGLADDLASTLYLAHDFKKPFLIAPAMNTSMYLHPETKRSIEHLKDLGLKILDTESGVLACGENGWGRLLDPELIFTAVVNSLSSAHDYSNEKKDSAYNDSLNFKKINILILAGGTSEPIDTVRSITNTSTGETGAELTDQLYQLGYETKLITSKKAHLPKSVLPIETYTTYSELEALVLDDKNIIYDVIINLAAISDFSVEKVFKFKATTKSSETLDPHLKISSDLDADETIQIELKKNPKLIHLIKNKFPQVYLIGFKLTSDQSVAELQTDSIPEAVLKVFQTGADSVVHNDLKDIQNNRRWFKFYSKVQSQNEKQYQTSDLCGSISDLAQRLSQKIIKQFNLKKEAHL